MNHRLAIIALSVASGASPALAQYPPPGSVPPPRSIIISRDVPQRPAFAPGQPGTVLSVETGPVDTIFGATDLIAVTLSDEQFAAISAGADTQHSAVDAAMRGANDALHGQDGHGAAQLGGHSFGTGFGGSIAGAMGTATSAIGGALAPLSSMGRPE
jgi:hypothetical protein